MSDNTCPVDVIESTGWHSHRCGRPVKRNGLCGIHATAKERVERNEREREERRAEGRKVVARLMAHGVMASTSYDGEARITMRAEALADLLDGRADA